MIFLGCRRSGSDPHERIVVVTGGIQSARRAPYIPKLEEDNIRQGFLEQNQYLALLEEIPDHLKVVLVVGYHCGNRLGELRKLQWPQVDLEALEIRIEAHQAKGKKPRTLPIYGDMVEWLAWQGNAPWFTPQGVG